jgi:uncharacterized membrane protein YhaH (DUF805 family)
MTERKLWFIAKRYGWGWQPATWQGWLVVVVYIAVILAAVAVAATLPLVTVLVSLGATTLLLWICYRTGEPPRWRWGDKD